MIVIHNEKEFETAINGKNPVLVKFSATWCGKCSILGKQMPGVEEKLKGICDVASIDADECKQIFDEYSVTHMPVLILFKDGKAVNTRPGVATAETIADFVKSSLQGK